MSRDPDIKAGVRAWIICMVLVIIALAMVHGCAEARDPDGRYDNSPYREWFRSQVNSAGGWCCDEADGHAYDGEYTFDHDGNVNIAIEGKPISVESWKVLKGPNPTGHAIVWYLVSMAGPQVYCFAPGTMG